VNQLSNPSSSNKVELDQIRELLQRITDNTAAGDAVYEQLTILSALIETLGQP